MKSESRPPRRLLVVLPNWVGDVVLATPALRALRHGLPHARITLLMRPHLEEILDGSTLYDEVCCWPTACGLWREWKILSLVRDLRCRRFDTAILLTNAFRSAWLAWRAGIRRRVGYARDGRGPLLTDRLRWPRERGGFKPISMVQAYGRLVERLGCTIDDPHPRLQISPAQQQAGQRLLDHYRLEPGRYALLAPGAAFGAAKCWPAERFAALADALAEGFGLRCVLAGAPGELPLLQQIHAAARSRPVVCHDPGTTLGTLKLLVREAALLVSNDSGPRHYGIALGTPTVTIFGPTDPAWTATVCRHERIVRVEVPCGPCQLRRCPLDHACMRGVTVASVIQAVRALLPPA